jgi:hypothetical protein
MAIASKQRSDSEERGQDALCRSKMMERLLHHMKQGKDVGHYGRLVFVMVGRFFLDEDEMVSLLKKQPGVDEESALGMVTQVLERGYNPPRRERILEWQQQQDFAIIADPDDPDCGNVYSDLRFPEAVYEDIEEYYEEKAEARKAA